MYISRAFVTSESVPRVTGYVRDHPVQHFSALHEIFSLYTNIHDFKTRDMSVVEKQLLNTQTMQSRANLILLNK